jgi:F-type H+-transporting ATPase subunit delta
MIKRSVALRYSKALFDIDRSNGQLETRLKDFDSLLELMKNNPKLLKFIEAPQVTLQEKEKVLKTCLSDKLDVTFFHFLLYLIEKRRLNYLAQIASEYRLMVNEELGIWEVEIITAVPIESDIEEKLKAKLEKFYQKKIKIKNEINSKMIGGAVLIIANEMIDWSIRGRLKKMKEHLLAVNV